MNPELLKYRIAITLIDGVGNNIAKNLIAYLGNEEAVFKESQKGLAKIPGIGEVLSRKISNHRTALRRAEEELEFIHKNNIQTYYYADKDYPFRLKECPDAPLMLFSKTTVNLNDAKFVAVVGTRNITSYGKNICRDFIYALSSVPNLVIVSGLAYGVDVCAHKVALEHSIPTIGVVAHGLDMIYPSMHRGTAANMLKNGGIVTEYLSKTNPDRQNFVQRNRIIAGMSDAVVVIESAQKGGALITADLGNDYNRDVFAFPGRIQDKWSKGCNALIKTNRANLIETPQDFLKLMNWDDIPKDIETVQTQLFTDLSKQELAIYTHIRKYPEGINVNELAVETAIPYSKLSSILLGMEFKALVKCKPGGIYKSAIPV